jgi:aspartyl-tRNA(Asn)/glutamyl-tRNA(Gln) amidotransferase subunit A
MLVEDPLGRDGLAAYAARLRSGAITAEAATRAYLDRIDALDGWLGAFEHVAPEAALATARALDALLQAGCDLGPLMGVPVAVKDLIAVEGMPTRAGTLLDVADLVGEEGPVIAALRRAGCVILGKTKTVEFALGITGVSAPRGTPWNPHDRTVHRLPGGSSSGSGVAVAAGLCAFAIGSDTGGSVRVPAAMNGVFGLKTSPGRLSNEGAFPLAPHLDTIGFLTRSAGDAALAFAVVTGEAPPPPPALSCLRLGRPSSYFFDALDPRIEARVEEALATLRDHGCEVAPFDLPEAPEREAYFPVVLPVCLVASLGRERAGAGLDRMDPVIAARVATAFEVDAVRLVELEQRRQRSIVTAGRRFEGFDAWITPATASLPAPLAELEAPGQGLALALGMTRNTQPANYLDLPAISLPLPGAVGDLPMGLQLIGRPSGEHDLLATAVSLESVLGRIALPGMTAQPVEGQHRLARATGLLTGSAP